MVGFMNLNMIVLLKDVLIDNFLYLARGKNNVYSN